MLAIITTIAGCADFNAAMTPGAVTIKDDFSGATIIRQDSISASSSLSESFHTIGFEWSTHKPDTVYITAGLAMQTRTIQGVQFKADGQTIENIELASTHTEYENQASSRRFALPLAEFRKIAAASEVKMKVVYDFENSYSVSSFGTNHPLALTTKKIPPFISQIDTLKH